MSIFDKILRRSRVATTDPKQPAYWLQKLFMGGVETAAGIQVDETTALTFSAVWAAVNVISGAVGFLPLVVYRRLERGKERNQAHPVYSLLHDRPNAYMDAMVFRETLQGHVLTWGNGYAEIERDNAGRAIALWPLPPNQVEPRMEDNVLYYDVQLKTGGKAQVLPDDMLHVKGFGFDGFKGYSVVRMAAQSLSLGMAAEKFGASFFGNGSVLSGVFEHPGTLSPNALKEFKRDWKANHEGLNNAHRTAVLENGMKWHQLGIPPEDAQYLETRRFQIGDVARWYGVPLHMLGDLERATFSNIEHQGIEFVTWCLMKWLRRWELEVDRKLFAESERGKLFTEFLTAALLRGDTKTRYEAYNIARQGGWLNVNEIRAMENLNPIDGGDTYLEPLNMKPLGEPDPEPDPEPTEEQDDENARALLENVWRRVMVKQTNAARKASKSTDTFAAWVDTWFAGHEEYVAETLEPVLRMVVGPELSCAVASDAARHHIETSITELRGGTVPDEWLTSKPSELAARVLAGVKHGNRKTVSGSK
jgi:HK97 family phage portal protein